jgi:hypothetical protein
MLYIRISDVNDTHVYRVLPVAPLVNFSHPEAQVDKESNLHVISQTGASSFAYIVVTPQGEIQTRHRYDYSDTRPVLRPRDGKIYVSGGYRRVTPDDIPPVPRGPVMLNKTNDTPTPKP